MITSVVQRKRPRWPVFVLMGGAVVAAGLVAAVALAIYSDTGTYDITVPDNNQSAGPLTLAPSGGSVEYIGSSANNQASGTGLFDPFVRLQGSPTEKGYNTCSQSSGSTGGLCNGDVTQFDTKSGSWTHPIKVNAIPLVDCGLPDKCWELFNDINENNTAKRISLNVVELWFTTNPRLTGYVDPTGFPVASGATKQYEFNGDILINDVNQGSGRGDLRYLIPTTGLSWDANTYFVLYSKWGTTPSSTTAQNGTGNWASDGGFEEWKVRKVPNVSITKTADASSVNAGTAIGFTITVTNTGVADATGVSLNDPLPGGTGVVTPVHWTIASQSGAGGTCAISGSDGSQVLTCGPVTLAAGGGSLSVHVTASTTGDNCGVYDNTATFTSTNAGTGSASASVTVLCPDVSVVKTPDSEATGPGTVGAGSDAVFTIVTSNAGPGTATSVTLTDNLPAGSGPLHWTIDTDTTGLCGITGADGSQVLSCPYGDLASGASRTVIVKATTSPGDCFLNGSTGDIENTASASATNEASTTLTDNSDHGDVNVTCAAIQILKESTKSGNPLVSNAGAVFHVTGPGGYAADVTDNGTGDEDSTVGSVCVSGLTPGEYTVTETSPPAGYGSGTAVDDTSTAANGTDCGSHKPSTANSAVFTDPPLYDLQVNFADGGSGETSATISCSPVDPPDSTTPPSGWDTSSTYTDRSAPETITCTIEVDP